jgi:peptidoglycan/LPS O-acetylase OafA/YrhL
MGRHDLRRLPLTSATADRRAALPALTGLRVVAAVWVVLFHYRDDLEALAPWLSPLDTFMRAGYLGVDLFFPLSGFILAYNYADQLAAFSWTSARAFVQNRFARVWPVHVVTLHVDLAIAAAVGTLGVGEGGHRRTPAAYVENLALVHNWFNDRPSFNGPAWSIGSEWFAYLLAPALFVAFARVTRARSALLGAVLAYAAMLGVYALFALPNGNLEHLFFVRIMGEFVAGMLLCLAWVRGGRSLGRLWPVLPGALVVAAVVPAASAGDYWLAPLLGLSVAAVAGAGGWLRTVLSAPFMVAAGEASFCLYMTHDLLRPLVTAVRHWGETAWWSASLAVVALAGCFAAAAWGMHVLVERPARRLLHAPSARRAPAAASSQAPEAPAASADRPELVGAARSVAD